MANDDKLAKLLARARSTPASLKFSDLCSLASMVGYEHARTKGAHSIYRHATAGMMNFQREKGGMAKAYQVQQLVDAIDRHGLA